MGGHVTNVTDFEDVTLGGSLLFAGGTVTTAGNNTVVTPTAGKQLRVYYLSYNNEAAGKLGFRFGAAGALFLNYRLVANSVIAKELTPRFLQGAADEVLILNLDTAFTANWTVFYREV